MENHVPVPAGINRVDFGGECAEGPKVELFDQLDFGDRMLKPAAIAVCNTCELRIQCQENFGELREDLAARGVQDTVIGARETLEKPPFTMTPLGDDPHEALTALRGALRAGAFVLRGRNLKLHHSVALETLQALPADQIEGLELPAITTQICNAVEKYNFAYGKKIGGAEEVTPELMAGIATEYIADIREAKLLGLPCRQYGTMLYNAPADLARALGEFSVMPGLNRGVVAQFIHHYPSSYRTALLSYAARRAYLHERIEPRIREEIGNISFSNTVARDLCRTRITQLGERARELARSAAEHVPPGGQLTLQHNGSHRLTGQWRTVRRGEDITDEVMERYKNRLGLERSTLVRLSERPIPLDEAVDLYENAFIQASVIVQSVDAPEWVARQLARWNYKGDILTAARRWRREYLRLRDKHAQGRPKVIAQLQRAALARFPDIELEVLLQNHWLQAIGISHGRAVMAELRKTVPSASLWYRSPPPSKEQLFVESVMASMQPDWLVGVDDGYVSTVVSWALEGYRAAHPDAAVSRQALTDALRVFASDVRAFAVLKFQGPNRVAMKYSIVDFKRLVMRFGNDESICLGDLKQLVASKSSQDFPIALGELKAQRSSLRRRYGDKISKGLQRRITTSKGRFDSSGDIVVRLDRLMEVNAKKYPRLSGVNLNRFAVSSSSPEDAEEKFTAWCEAVAQMHRAYGEHPYFKRHSSLFKRIIPYFQPEQADQIVRNFISLCGDLLTELKPRGADESMVLTSVAERPSGYRKFLEVRMRTVREVRTYLGEDAEEYVVRYIARAQGRRMDRADEWREEYRRLRPQIVEDPYFRDWIVQRAALHPTKSRQTADRYMTAVRLGLIDDDPYTAPPPSSSPVSDEVPFEQTVGVPIQQSAEADYLDTLIGRDEESRSRQIAEKQRKAKRVAQALKPLSLYERAAVALIFRIEAPPELVSPELLDEGLVMRHLKTSHLEQYVLNMLLPKIQKYFEDI